MQQAESLVLRAATPPTGEVSGLAGRLRALLPRNRSEALKRLQVLLIVLLVLQGLRAIVPVARAEWLLRSASAEEEQATREKLRDPLTHYNAILEKGVLGIPPQEQPPQLFGVLGNVALIGGSPEQVQEFSEGAELPNGEKIVRIGVESVDLEKDGKKRTLTVFPEMKKQ